LNAIVACLRLVLVLALAALLAAPAAADPIEDFYKGKVLTIIIGAPPGGAYDLYARTLAKYLPRHVPGHPNAIAQNMVGSGSVQAVNRIYFEAPQDGTVIGAPSNAAPFLPLLGLEQARFDPKKMLWLGSPTAETSVFFVWYTVPVEKFEDLKTHEVIVGSNGPNASPGFFAKAMNAVFNTKIKTVYGYTGVPDAMLALQRGEIQGYTGIFWNQLTAGYGNLIEDKKLKFLLQFGVTPNPDLAGVPLASDLISTQEDKQLFAAVMAPLAIGYPLLMGPGVPADRGSAMVKAIADTFADKDFLAEAKDLKLAIAPLSGAAVARTIDDSYAIPPQLIDRLRFLYNSE
jgi:tripartite-type tricarboxylate transporter receptor subunit TctC